MGKIIKEIGLLGSKNKFTKLKALFDTGATTNFIKKKFEDGSSIDDIGILQYHERGRTRLGNQDEIPSQKIKLKLLKFLDIKGLDPIEKPEFCLLDELIYDVIIGVKLMQQLKMVLNPLIHEISFS